MLNKDYTTISEEMRSKISNQVKTDLEADIVFICKDSDHPDDYFLFLYVAKKGDEYITGLANTCRNGHIGLYDNHYNCTFKQAMQVLSDKIHESWNF